MITWCKKKSHHNFIRIVIFVIYYKGVKKVISGYLCHLTFTLSKFTFKNFLFLKIVSNTMVSPNIFLSIMIVDINGNGMTLSQDSQPNRLYKPFPIPVSFF